MTKGIIHARREKFVRLMVDVSTAVDMIRVYKECFPNCKKDASARSACYRMLQDVDIVAAIDKLKQEKEEALKKAKQKEIERLAREAVITETQIDAKLSSIVMGTDIRKKKIAAFNPKTGQFHSGTIDETPDQKTAVAAANLLYKRKGAFAEKKIKHEMGDSFIEALKNISKLKAEKANVQS